jgi:hypothetical protein
MEAFLAGLINLLPGPLRPIAGPVVARLLAVWRWSQSLGVRVRGGWRLALTGGLRLRDGLRRLAAEGFLTLRWIVEIRIPAIAGAAREAAIAWASTQLAKLATTLDAARRFLIDLVARSVATLRAWVDAWRAYLVGLIAGAVNGLDRLLERVFRTWATPERLVAWIFGALWSALWRHVWANLDALAESVIRRRQAIALRVLTEAERIIGRVL